MSDKEPKVTEEHATCVPAVTKARCVPIILKQMVILGKQAELELKEMEEE